MSRPPVRIVLFVCEHGVFRSRVAAALFNAMVPAGARAVSAGRMPEGKLSDNARRVLAGTPAAGLLEDGAARAIESVPQRDEIIAIDCDVPGALRWTLQHDDAEGVAEDLRQLVRDLVAGSDGPSGSAARR